MIAAMLMFWDINTFSLSPYLASSKYELIHCDRVSTKAQSNETVLFLGDSITQDWQSEELFKANSKWINLGRGGTTANGAAYRICGEVIPLNPSVVHVMYGTNDIAQKAGARSLDQIAGDLAQITLSLRAYHIRVVLGSVLPTSEFPWHKGLQPAPKVIALNAWLRSFAASHCLVYADYWSSMANSDGGLRNEFSNDGVHPNSRGYTAMAPIADRAITAADAKCTDNVE